MRRAYTLLELLIVIAIIGMMLALLLPAINRIRELAAVAKSQNHLRQIALGLHHAADAHDGHLPALFSMRPHSDIFFLALLPYIGEESLFRNYRATLQLPTSDFYFSAKMPVKLYTNPLDRSAAYWQYDEGWFPTDDIRQLSVSCYAANAQFFMKNPHLNQITDGTSHTIWLTEHYGFYCNGTTFVYDSIIISPLWQPMQIPTFAQDRARPRPGDYAPIVTGQPPVTTAEGGRTFQVAPHPNECDPRLPNSTSHRGLQVALADGSVRMLAPSISATTFWSAVTPSGGEVLGNDW